VPAHGAITQKQEHHL